MRERGRDNFLLPRECCFSSFFVYSCCNELLLELLLEIFRPGRFVVLRRSLVSATLLLFRVLLFRLLRPIFSFHQNNNERIYYYITTSQRRERKREREKGEKLLKTAFPSHHHRKTSSTKQKRDREIERITHKHRRRELCFVPNSARIFKKKR